MSKVYVITSAHDYEGESPIGVAATLEVAKTIAERTAMGRGYEVGNWAIVRDQHELQFGSAQFIVREEEVRT